MVLPGVLVGFACGVGHPVLPHRLPWGTGGVRCSQFLPQCRSPSPLDLPSSGFWAVTSSMASLRYAKLAGFLTFDPVLESFRYIFHSLHSLFLP